MQQIHTIVQLLEKKKDLFLQFERESEQMCFCPVEEIEGHLQQLLRLQEEIEALDSELSEQYNTIPPAERAASNQDSPDAIAPELRPVYERAMEVRGVVNRILQNGPMLEERLTLERNALLKKLEENRQSSGSIAKKYYNSVHTGVNQPFFGQKVTKV